MAQPEIRKATTKILEMVDEGLLDARKVLAVALDYMSEADVVDLASCEGYIEDEEEDEPEEDEEEDEDDA
jgi:hypothetical protein